MTLKAATLKATGPQMNASPGRIPNRRLASVDCLRAVAIICMIQVHFVGNLAPRSGHPLAYDISMIFGGIAAPIFSFLVGFSVFLLERNARERGRGERDVTRTLLKRGAFLFAAGLVFAAIIWTPSDLFAWDILTLLGASMVLLSGLRRLPAWSLACMALAVIAAAPVLREVFGYAAFWSDGEYVVRFDTGHIILGFLLRGYFPILPWLAYPLLGYAAGRQFHAGRNTDSRPPLPMLLSGIVLLGAGVPGLFDLGSTSKAADWYASALSFYPASTSYVLGTLGMICIALWLLMSLSDGGAPAKPGLVTRVSGVYSRMALTAYVIHHAVHIWPLMIASVVNGHEDGWEYFEEALSVPVALVLSLAFMVVFYFVASLWEKKSWMTLEMAMRRIGRSGPAPARDGAA